jgi:hypothetical protein
MHSYGEDADCIDLMEFLERVEGKRFEEQTISDF